MCIYMVKTRQRGQTLSRALEGAELYFEECQERPASSRALSANGFAIFMFSSLEGKGVIAAHSFSECRFSA